MVFGGVAHQELTKQKRDKENETKTSTQITSRLCNH